MLGNIPRPQSHVTLSTTTGPLRVKHPVCATLVHELQSQGHIVTVVLPNQQRSWIGKAHFVEDVIGLHHYHPYQQEGKPIPIDLVVSGPNLGANATALFSLFSGTIGGAMEAVLCGKRSIALSFEPATKDDICNQGQITDASRHAVRLIEHLYHSWDDGVELYSVNIPLRSVPSGDRKVVTRNADSPLLLRWAPDLSDIHGSMDRTSDADDDWAVREGKTSVAPLKANFMHAAQCEGEIHLG
ncbi:sure-like protein [Aspergillus uvarum CBS 121591]|uniref:Sure-like protein n=1 Tax=Aspergillus uvarum CBS 121591 TaxID=1448315 RepID=A0A319BUQ3_9EURO|nr:sure-like protein [Aspergillus uvarum CBS 121591]PYH76161.1 sure-like protein [Aspergillus uvarum CBS 121591]